MVQDGVRRPALAVRGWWGAAGVSMSYKITLQSSYLDTDTFHPTATQAPLVRATPFSVVRAWFSTISEMRGTM